VEIARRKKSGERERETETMLSLSLNATHASFATRIAVSLAVPLVLACTHAAAGPVVYTCSYMRDKKPG